jgi:hypothetical protein
LLEVMVRCEESDLGWKMRLCDCNGELERNLRAK